MAQPTSYKCHISACLDRTFYLAGDRVSGQCYVRCSSEVSAQARGPMKPLVLCDEDNFFCADAGEFADEDGEKAILVHSLTATVESRCDVNPKLLSVSWDSRTGADPPAGDSVENGSTGGMLASWMPRRQSTSRVFFRTPKFDLLTGTSVSNGECVAVAFSFCVPDSAAPSFTGEACQLKTAMQLDVSWRVRRGKASSTVQTQSLTVPIRIVSPPSSVPLLLAATAPIVTAESPLVLSRYEFVAKVLPSVPTAKLLALPWSAAAEKSSLRGQKEEWLAARAAQRERYNALTAVCEPGRFHVAIPRSGYGVSVQLATTHICLGDTLTGIVTVVEDAREGQVEGHNGVATAVSAMLPPESRGVLLSVDAALEQSECTIARATPVVGAASGHDSLKCLGSRIVDRQGWTLTRGAQTVFKFFISPRYDPSMLTDVISNVWRLRLSFLCTSQAFAARETPRGFPVLTSSPELNVLLTVAPPSLHERIPAGPLVS